MNAITERYKENLDILIINTGILDEENMKTMMKIAKDNSVTELPSILLISKKGKPNFVVSGEFDEVELEKSIDRLVKN